MSPFNAWVFLKGLETLELRMLAHARNARILATWLRGQPGAVKVHFPGLDAHPQHHLVGTQQRTGGGIVAFEVDRRANKYQIKTAVEDLFKVTVNSVRTVVMPGKIKRLGRYQGKTPTWKKAIVQLGTDQQITEFENL